MAMSKAEVQKTVFFFCGVLRVFRSQRWEFQKDLKAACASGANHNSSVEFESLVKCVKREGSSVPKANRADGEEVPTDLANGYNRDPMRTVLGQPEAKLAGVGWKEKVREGLELIAQFWKVLQRGNTEAGLWLIIEQAPDIWFSLS